MDVLAQVAAFVGAFTVIVGGAALAGRLRFLRWLMHQLIGGPIIGWFDKQVRRHTDPINAKVEHIGRAVNNVPDGSPSLPQQIAAVRTELGEVAKKVKRVDARQLEDRKLIRDAAKLLVETAEKERVA